MDKHFLITGGAGFIGANLVRRLAGTGAPVRVLDNLSGGRAADLAGLPVELAIGDIRDEHLVRQVMTGIDIVIHLAAHTEVVRSIENPELNHEINVKGTLNLLQASVRQGVERFIFASTGGAILGDVEPPAHEDMVPHPISPYGASKLAAEGYCSAFWGSYGLKTVALRFSNVYGPYSYHKGSVIAIFCRNIRQGRELIIFGDGDQTRDFVYVEDLCQAILAAAQRDLPFGEAIQLGTGTEISINQLTDNIKAVVGPNHFPPVRYAPPRAGEVRRNYVSIARAQQYLGFAPQTKLEEGLRRTWAWFQQQSQPTE
ncbi:MAG: NAD-dependent epimerase/dehydratase family protein [Desulfobacteraceae bacterium]